jgi:hypothetical protein
MLSQDREHARKTYGRCWNLEAVILMLIHLIHWTLWENLKANAERVETNLKS